MPLRLYDMPKIGSVQRGLLHWPALILGWKPGLWPESLAGGRLGAVNATLSAYLLGRYLAAPAMQAVATNVFGRDDESRNKFRNRVGLAGAAATGLPLALLTWPRSDTPPAMKAASLGLFGDFRDVPIAGTVSQIIGDPTLSLPQKAMLLNTVEDASGGRSHGLISKGDLARAAVNAGLGYAAGHALGSVFGLPEMTKRRLSQAGMIGSLLLSSGVVR